MLLNGSLVPVLPLSNPSRKVVLSNVPPFIKDDVLVQELSVMENWFPLSKKSLSGVSRRW